MENDMNADWREYLAAVVKAEGDFQFELAQARRKFQDALTELQVNFEKRTS